MSTLIQHSSASNGWLTPLPILEKVRQVLGPIDLDPASNASANERVKAKRFLTSVEDGLVAPWHTTEDAPTTVYLNPPGGKRGNRSLPQLFWERLMQFRSINGRLRHAIFMAFSAEALQTTQRPSGLALGDFIFCVPSKRLRFDDEQGVQGTSPSHSNVIVYVPCVEDRSHKFARVFSEIGTISVPYRWICARHSP